MRKLLFTVSFPLFVLMSSAYGQSFEDEKQIIDAHHEGGFKTQIQGVFDYVMNILPENSENRYDQETILSVLRLSQGGVLPLQKPTKEFCILYGGMCLLTQILEKNTPTPYDVIDMARIASVLFSPEIFQVRAGDVINKNILKLAVKHVERLKKAGQYFLGDEELEDEVFDHYYTMPENSFCGNFFIPLILSHNNAVYSEEAFLYALSKGIFIFGLSHEINTAHGGIYKYPAFFLNHDFAHHNELLRPDNIKKISDYSDESLYLLAAILKKFASDLYGCIKDEEIFSPEDRPRALRAAFLILHENAIYNIKSDILNANEDELYSRIQESACTTLKERLKKASDALSLDDVEINSDEDLRIKNAHDYALMMAQIFPTEKNKIFIKDKPYDADYVLTLMLELINWFSEQKEKRDD